MMMTMRLVPRQLRKSTFPSSVPYYGGRLTPQVIAGLGSSAAPPPAPRPAPRPQEPAPAPLAPERSRQLAALDDLRQRGVVTDEEYERIRGRIFEHS